ncbi:hypothetical protein FSP39_013351 [Pinctada imbricata]|uniref:Outer dynein arm-docking complex subunit 4 n=1 Tax=Pinctada imbricata TaxID=66713 RepID=A0AA89C2F7_PINIB|nr:hypothetical protein FSP39_013351 [Pinctada imbricata]
MLKDDYTMLKDDYTIVSEPLPMTTRRDEFYLKTYPKALKLHPSDIKALVARSRCYTKLRKIRKAIDDVDTALHLDNLHKEALRQKADLLFKTENYEMASVYYNRGLKHYPRNKDFQDGVIKAEKEMNRGRLSRSLSRTKVRRMKMTEAGDLTYLVHKVPKSKGFSYEKPKSRTSYQPPSATFSTRPLCQLIRIHKTPTVALPGGPNIPKLSSLETFDFEEKRPDTGLIKETIAQMVDDKKLLQLLMDKNRFPGVCGSNGTPVDDLAEDGLSFILERASYWDRLGPLPPPPPPRKSRNSRLSGSSMSLDSHGSYRSIDSKTWKSNDSVNTDRSSKKIKSKYAYGKKKKDKPKIDPAVLNFKFRSLGMIGEMDQRMMTEIEEEDEVSIEHVPNEEEVVRIEKEPEDTAGQSITEYVKKELDEIYEDFSKGKYGEVSSKCNACLRLLSHYRDEQVPEKFEMIANLHSYLGNTAMQTGKFDISIKHHEADLMIGNQLEMDIIRSRALGNLGRIYMIKGKHKEALEMFTAKAPMCKNPKESTILFHEIGNCFLLLKNFSSAREAGGKTLKMAMETGDVRMQLQASILNGLAEVNMKKYQSAHDSFEIALDHAKSLGDEKAEAAMKHALIDVNKRMANKIKRTKLKKEVTYPSSNPTSSARTVLVEG